MTGRLQGKVAIITGGNSGIGETTAHVFSQEGAKVVIMARRNDQGLRVQNEIRQKGGEATFVQCDVGNDLLVNEAVEQASSVYGDVHLLFNNAGHGSAGDFPNSTTEQWNSVINDNLNGTFYVSRAVWPHIIKSGGGAIVNMSSLAAVRGFSPKMMDDFGVTAPSYYAAKAGIEGLTRQMAGVGGKHNIRVNCIRPGQILTPGATRGTISDLDGGHHVFESMFDMAQIIPGPGYPIDVANLVMFLVSDESRFITSEIINIDGGVAAKI
jgi:3-oxoacyl-[acyl-carrier protein] reductase